MSNNLLPHDSINPNGKTTILLIHGALSQRGDWDMVTPYLSEYHVLVPDLPGHGEAKDQAPFSLERSANMLIQLIRTTAIGGAAHVVGHSLGASVALKLAATDPDVVKSMLISGYGRLPKTWFTPYLPYALWTEQRIENLIPRPAIRWLMDGTDLRRGGESSWNVELIRQCFGDSMSKDEWPVAWPARTLIIAATKRGIIPSNDNAELAKKICEIGRELNPNTTAVAHPAMRHPWIRQAPELFANTVKAWLEESRLPDGFKQL